MEKLTITSPCFEDGGLIPIKYTGYGEDCSPELVLTGLREEAISIAIIMNDMNHPIPAYNHWVIWNIPAMTVIPQGFPQGRLAKELQKAVQGLGYGRNRYRGPKPPFHWSHIYQFNIYALDCFLDLSSRARKKDLLAAMEGHVLQQGTLSGHYR